MNILSMAGLPVGSLVFQSNDGRQLQTIFSKITYRLEPGMLSRADVQEPIVEHEVHLDANPSRSVVCPDDLVPFKQRVDVVLVGRAHAPNRASVRSLVVRLVVGEIDKAIEILPRRSLQPDGSVREGPQFATVALRYEYAAGGPNTWNPVGIVCESSLPVTPRPLPQMVPVGVYHANPLETVAPIGFGPIAASWPSRSGFARELSFYQCAPRDQQLDTLRPDETIILEHLHPDHPRLVMRLPGLSMRTFIRREEGPPTRVAMQPDTLFIDTERQIICVTYRGQTAVEADDESAVALVVLDEANAPASFDQIEERYLANASGVPSPSRSAVEESTQVLSENVVVASSALPFIAGASVALPASSMHRRDDVQSGHTREIRPEELLRAQGATPFESSKRPVVIEPPPVTPLATVSSWAMAAQASTFPLIESTPIAPAIKNSPAILSTDAGKETALRAAGYLGAVAASNAAALLPTHEQDAAANKAQPFADEAKLEPNPIELVFFDEAMAERIRERDPWSSLLAKRPDPPKRRRGEPPPPPVTPERLRERVAQDISDILASATPTNLREISSPARVHDDLCLLAGALFFPFDGVAELEATVAAASPLASKDHKLENAIARASEALQFPLDGSPEIVADHLRSVREAFAAANKTMPRDYLALQVERSLLSKRKYVLRDVLDGSWIRAELKEQDNDGAAGLPVYVPAAHTRRLPLFRQFRAHIIAQVVAQQDMYETHPYALRVVALGRVLAPAAK